MIQRELTPAEVSDLEARNPDLQVKVTEHYVIVDSVGWSQAGPNDWHWPDGTPIGESLPIPTSGITYNDAVYGTVVIFPDASGNLHFNVGVAGATSAAIGAYSPYASPSGNSLTQTLQDILGGLKNAWTGAGAGIGLVVAAGLIYLFVLKETK